MIKKVLNMKKIGMLLLLITIVTFNLIIGANEKGLRIMPISILLAFIVMYLIIYKIKNKKEIIFFRSRVDFFVLIFMLTTILPLVFKTYVSYSDTVEFIIKYFFIYSVYVLARNVVKEKKQIEIIITVTIISSLIPVILGIDGRTNEVFKQLMQWLNITYNSSAEFCGTFGYANTMGIYMAFCIFLAMHKLGYNKNNFLKGLYIIYILVALFIIIFTKSKAVILLLGLVLFILFIIRVRKKIINHKKKIVVCIIVFIILFITYLLIGIKISRPIIDNYNDVNQTIKYHFIKDNNYNIKIELTTINTTDLHDFYKSTAFEVQLLEGGKYFNDQIIQTKSLSDFKGKIEFDFIPTKDIDYIRIIIENKFHGTIELGDCYINGEKRIINYRYISKDLANLVQGYSITGISIPQRIYMYQDCLKIAKDSPIVGNGGDAWKNVSRAVEDYTSALKECHSYFFELLISYGIVGVIGFLTLALYFFIKIFKQCKKDINKRKEKLFILLGLLILIIHAMFDFDMSFMLIQLILYIYMALLIYDEHTVIIKLKKEAKIYKMIDIILILFLSFVLSIYIRADIANYLINENTKKYSVFPYNKMYYKEKIKEDIENKKNYIDILNELQDIMNRELYYAQNENFEMYFRIICSNINQINEEELKNYFDYGINRLKTIRVATPLFFDKVINRANILKNTVLNLNNYLKDESITQSINKENIIKDAKNKLEEIINEEYEININNMNNFEIHSYNELFINLIKKQYEEIINTVRENK